VASEPEAPKPVQAKPEEKSAAAPYCPVLQSRSENEPGNFQKVTASAFRDACPQNTAGIEYDPRQELCLMG
jgi:hypothetical protein